MPHCLGGQVRGGCAKWEEREAMGLPMPLGSGPAIDSTFVCPLWEAGGPSVKQVGSFNTGSPNKTSSVSGPIGVLIGIAALGAVKNYVAGKEDRKDQDALDRTYDEFYYE
jgi:hypothetical protein